MNWLPDERFSELQMERLHDSVHGLQQDDPHFCRAPRKAKFPLRFYRGK